MKLNVGRWIRALSVMTWAAAISMGQASAQGSPPRTLPAAASHATAAIPAWVKPIKPDLSLASRPLPPGTKAHRHVLLDSQVNLMGTKPVYYQHIVSAALDSSTLREVSEPAISYNPAYQKLVLHTAQVHRNGKSSNRLKDARIETMRREQSLERQMLDGVHTALVMLKDVRVGDIVEVAYSLEGENPIFEGKYSDLFHLGAQSPIDQLHIRIEAPAHRQFQFKSLATQASMTRSVENGRQVYSFDQRDIAPVREESATPPWFKVYPVIQVSEYRSWQEVDAWAQRLFALEPPTGEVAAKIAEWKSKGLAPDALLAEVLTFVQDDVRYFSMSLGESSHRPKPALRTLAERMGDCKDKVLLLNTLLTGLGFDAKPVLVSMFRNRGITQYLPSHDQFDHVISVVKLDGQSLFLDATVQGQGKPLKSRGYFPYGAGLTIGDGQALQRVDAPDFALDDLYHQQEWDLSDLKRPAQLTTRMTARGLAAERWRSSIAARGLDRLSQSIAGSYARAYPGLQPQGSPELKDNRDTNELTLVHRFERALPGRYKNGLLEFEFLNIELGEVLVVPSEAKRTMPFLVDQPRVVDVRIQIRSPRPVPSNVPAPVQITDRHFNFQSRLEVKEREVTMRTRYERRSEEVQAAHVDVFREKTSQARQNSSRTLRVLLLDRSRLEPIGREVDRRTSTFMPRSRTPDALMNMIRDLELERLMADAVLPDLDAGSPLAIAIAASRSQARNLLGEYEEGLSGADAVLARQGDHSEALAARGVALMGLHRTSEATKVFEQQLRSNNPEGAVVWLAISQFSQGHYAAAQATLQQHLGSTTGDERTFALIWLALTGDRQQRGQGATLVADDLVQVDPQSWPGALLHHLTGRISRTALLSQVEADPDQARLRMAEASFFIGQQLLMQGQRDEAKQWFERCLQTRALPYREVSLARMELNRLGGPSLSSKLTEFMESRPVPHTVANSARLLQGLGEAIRGLMVP